MDLMGLGVEQNHFAVSTNCLHVRYIHSLYHLSASYVEQFLTTVSMSTAVSTNVPMTIKQIQVIEL